MAFKAEDINQAYKEGVRHERKRIMALLEKVITIDHVDLADVWDEIRKDQSHSLNHFNKILNQ